MNSIVTDSHNYMGPTATPIIFSNITIEANGAQLQHSGDLNFRALAVGTASVDAPGGSVSGTGHLTIRNAFITDFKVQGGNGTGGGGGGMGAGGAIYLNGGALTAENCTFESNSATGGNGSTVNGGAGGGGGGVGGNGGEASPGNPPGEFASGGGGGSRGNGASDFIGGGGGTVTDAQPGRAGGFNCGGHGGDSNGTVIVSADAGARTCPGGGGAGGGGTFSGGPGHGGAFGRDADKSHGGGGAGLGGAIFNDSGDVTIRNCTFFFNEAIAGGGPLLGRAAGGAIFSVNGSLTVLNSTINSNRARTSDFFGQDGAGDYVVKGNLFSTSFTLRNTIISNDTTSECVVAGSVTTDGAGNLLGSNGNHGCPGVVNIADPRLGPFQLNAPGLTPTLAISANSPAFNAGDSTGGNCLATDQRGVSRPQLGGCDIGAYEVACSLLSCSPNITKPNDPDKCGAVVTYNPPTVNGPCTPVCSPISGTFFPVGTTTVTCSAESLSCSFTVTVNDTQKPAVTCPANITRTTAKTGDPTLVINYTTPTPTDNCSGVSVTCTPPSGTAFPAGTTTVTCTATDHANNQSSCSFTVTIFDACVQDDSNPNNSVAFNTRTGDYLFCAGGVKYSGKGTVIARGNTFTLQHSAIDRRVAATLDGGAFRGTASYQKMGAGAATFTVTDRDTRNDTCPCLTP